jgi:phage tail sheath protein FI
MYDIAEDRMDAIAVLDIPSNMQEVSDAVYFRRNDLNLDTSYAAIYGPDILIYDEYNDREVYVAPSGYVAAVMAKTDSDAATWFAPAGIDRGLLSIRGLRQVYNQGDRDALVDAQINPIRVIPNIGYVVWGADTLQVQPSALTNVNVRRLLNFIEKSIQLSAIYQVFEQNDEILWIRLTELCERFLKPIRAGRGVYWYMAVCDETNNTPETIGNGDTMLDVYVDPVIPAKRIHLRATVTRTGASFSESVQDASSGA